MSTLHVAVTHISFNNVIFLMKWCNKFQKSSQPFYFNYEGYVILTLMHLKYIEMQTTMLDTKHSWFPLLISIKIKIKINSKFLNVLEAPLASPFILLFCQFWTMFSRIVEVALNISIILLIKPKWELHLVALGRCKVHI